MSGVSYIDRAKLPYPFCPGCSHGPVLDRLEEAMARLDLDPTKAVIVSDIGCAGLSDQWFTTHAFHGLHGRSVVYGQGLKLAAPDLRAIVLMGDGGAGIGLHHLVNAAKRNIGITVIVFNNMNFGMTGGEHSITTPAGAITTTTSRGSLETPVRLCETLRANGAPFVARRAYYDDDLTDVLAKALAFDGFSFVEVMEFCAAYFVPLNKFSRKRMEEILGEAETPRMTFIDDSRTEYCRAYESQRRSLDGPPEAPLVLEKKFEHALSGKLDVVIAGSAGMRIGSTATLLARAAILSGLQAVQHDDYPVTVRRGHSVSFLKLSEAPIGYMGVESPNVVFALSPEGLAMVRGYLGGMRAGQSLYVLSGLPEVSTAAEVVWTDLETLGGRIPQDLIATAVVSAYLKATGVFPADALEEAIRLGRDENVQRQLDVLRRADPAVFRKATQPRGSPTA